MADNSLHVIEPTLEGEEGHCYSFIGSFCRAAGDYPLEIWCGLAMRAMFPGKTRVIPFFSRRIRRFQAFWLYWKLIRKPGRIFISTAGRTDLILLNLAASGKIPPNKVYLYIHWFRESKKREQQIANIAKRQPNLVIMTPTQSVYDFFRKAGFQNTRLVPYPITRRPEFESHDDKAAFTHLLFAGAARQDKGFSFVVALVERLAQQGMTIPVAIQTSADYYGKLDKDTARDISRLEACEYPFLKTFPATLSQDEYKTLFTGAICLQPYNRSDFADRISGITLDALSAGCPIITLQGTWMARTICRFDAGLAIDEPFSDELLAAVSHIMDNYPHYRRNALEAGRSLQKEHDAGYLFQVVTANGANP